MADHSEADKALARQNAEKIMRALWNCMTEMGAVPLCLVVANFDDEISAISPDGIGGIISIDKWTEIWPGSKPSAVMVGKIDTQ